MKMNTGLDEAAASFAKSTYTEEVAQGAAYVCFIAGAEWQVEQLKMPDKLKSLAIQTLFELDKNADENWRSSKQFTNGEVLNILKDFVAVYQQQVVDDEEIEKLAEKEYPPFRENKYGLRSEVSDAGREGYIEGFKSALQYKKPSAGVWVKASERKSTHYEDVFILYKEITKMIAYYDVSIDQYRSGTRTYNLNDVEWFDESALQSNAVTKQ